MSVVELVLHLTGARAHPRLAVEHGLRPARIDTILLEWAIVYFPRNCHIDSLGSAHVLGGRLHRPLPAHRRHFEPLYCLRILLRLRQPERRAHHPLWRHTPSKLRSSFHLLTDAIEFLNNSVKFMNLTQLTRQMGAGWVGS